MIKDGTNTTSYLELIEYSSDPSSQLPVVLISGLLANDIELYLYCK